MYASLLHQKHTHKSTRTHVLTHTRTHAHIDAHARTHIIQNLIAKLNVFMIYVTNFKSSKKLKYVQRQFASQRKNDSHRREKFAN